MAKMINNHIYNRKNTMVEDATVAITTKKIKTHPPHHIN